MGWAFLPGCSRFFGENVEVAPTMHHCDNIQAGATDDGMDKLLPQMSIWNCVHSRLSNLIFGARS